MYKNSDVEIISFGKRMYAVYGSPFPDHPIGAMGQVAKKDVPVQFQLPVGSPFIISEDIVSYNSSSVLDLVDGHPELECWNSSGSTGSNCSNYRRQSAGLGSPLLGSASPGQVEKHGGLRFEFSGTRGSPSGSDGFSDPFARGS